MAEQAVTGIQIAGVYQDEVRIVKQRDPHDEWRNPAGTVQPADIHPRDDPAADRDVAFVNFDGWAERHEKQQPRRQQEQSGRYEGGWQLRAQPTG